ncbi:MAG: NusA-like transcription termination signal-binding factor [Candidatus Aenigmarchaeota archaeon]|nr:NusA-like transcription termination signal-binding factor [Candidatus Aenigmarchaeota archaeon]
MQTIGFINVFEKSTKVAVLDCIFDDDNIYFLVEFGKAGMAIGKNGKNIKKLQQVLKRQVKVFEYNKEPKKFIENMIPSNTSVVIDGSKANVIIDQKEKGKIIGRMGYNIKKIRELLERNSEIKKLNIK